MRELGPHVPIHPFAGEERYPQTGPFAETFKVLWSQDKFCNGGGGRRGGVNSQEASRPAAVQHPCRSTVSPSHKALLLSDAAHRSHPQQSCHQSHVAPVTCGTSHVWHQSRVAPVMCGTSHMWHQSHVAPVTRGYQELEWWLRSVKC